MIHVWKWRCNPHCLNRKLLCVLGLCILVSVLWHLAWLPYVVHHLDLAYQWLLPENGGVFLISVIYSCYLYLIYVFWPRHHVIWHGCLMLCIIWIWIINDSCLGNYVYSPCISLMFKCYLYLVCVFLSVCHHIWHRLPYVLHHLDLAHQWFRFVII